MKITGLEYRQLDLPLKNPYRIAYETVTRSPNVILKIITDQGLVGYGCACPDLEVTKETPDDVVRALDGPITAILKGSDAFRHSYFHHALAESKEVGSSALAMVDIALYDLLARKAGLPLFQVLGGYRNHIPTSITIGIKSLVETLEDAGAYLSQGFRILKLKGGDSCSEDIEKVRKLRDAFGTTFDLRFDANQGYTPQQALRFMNETRTAGVEILEQPTPTQNPTALKQVTRGIPEPVMADESVRSLADAFHLTSNGMIDMINIKIQKVGGIQQAAHINSVARAGGLEVMIGCLDECGLGIAAGLHFALSRPNIQYADLDGHLDLIGDPFVGLFEIRDGILYPSADAGLGSIEYLDW